MKTKPNEADWKVSFKGLSKRGNSASKRYIDETDSSQHVNQIAFSYILPFSVRNGYGSKKGARF